MNYFDNIKKIVQKERELLETQKVEFTSDKNKWYQEKEQIKMTNGNGEIIELNVAGVT